MNTRLILSSAGVLLAAASATAEDAPKLVPRGIPGLFDKLNREKSSNDEALALLESAVNNKRPPPIEVPEATESSSSGGGDDAPARPASTKAVAVMPEAPVKADANAPARILFIHRRATLPPEMTADLAKPGMAKTGQVDASSQILTARPGKVRIIPKEAVAAFFASEPSPKPQTP